MFEVIAFVACVGLLGLLAYGSYQLGFVDGVQDTEAVYRVADVFMRTEDRPATRDGEPSGTRGKDGDGRRGTESPQPGSPTLPDTGGTSQRRSPHGDPWRTPYSR